MRLSDHIIKVPLFHSAVSFTQITKGFSHEEKWIVNRNEGDDLFIKIYSNEFLEHAKSVYTYLESFYKLGSNVPKPIQFIELPDENICIQIVTFVSGEDGEEYLQTVSSDTQYKLGYQAGKELRKIHSLSNPSVSQSWEVYRLTKFNKYLNSFNDSSITFPELNHILHFVETNKHILKNRPITFLHDDFHPANILFHGDKLAAIIDFDRYEWGDPYHDFHKIALFTSNISKPFAIGQIEGYFGKEPLTEFWHFYSLYAAMIIPSDIIWSYKTTPNLIDAMWKRVYRILDEHQNFEQIIPSWYREKSSL